MKTRTYQRAVTAWLYDIECVIATLDMQVTFEALMSGTHLA